jgi:hypothetical protein
MALKIFIKLILITDAWQRLATDGFTDLMRLKYIRTARRLGTIR